LAVSIRLEDGQARAIAFGDVVGGAVVLDLSSIQYLRIGQLADKFRFQISEDGETWITVAAIDAGTLGAATQATLAAASYEISSPRTSVYFDDLTWCQSMR
jgi:hypothetical protein